MGSTPRTTLKSRPSAPLINRFVHEFCINQGGWSLTISGSGGRSPQSTKNIKTKFGRPSNCRQLWATAGITTCLFMVSSLLFFVMLFSLMSRGLYTNANKTNPCWQWLRSWMFHVDINYPRFPCWQWLTMMINDPHVDNNKSNNWFAIWSDAGQGTVRRQVRLLMSQMKSRQMMSQMLEPDAVVGVENKKQHSVHTHTHRIIANITCDFFGIC